MSTGFQTPPGPGAATDGQRPVELVAPAEVAADAPRRAPRPALWRRRWVRWLSVSVIVLILVVLAASLLFGRAGAGVADDSNSVTKAGSAALAQLLRDQGVRLTRTEDVDRAGVAGATVLVVHPDELGAPELLELLAANPGRLVLLRPSVETLSGLGVTVPLTTVPAVAARVVEAQCTEAVAARAGSIVVPNGSLGYPASSSGPSCYPAANRVLYEQVAVRGRAVDVLGFSLDNTTLDQQGNAAFALGLLGSRPELVWLMADALPPAQTDRTHELLPPWWSMVVVEVMVGVVLLGVWRGRRLGPVISEQLPVAVRASETVEGHGQLYHRLAARERAAAALRDGVRRRLGPRYGQAFGPTSGQAPGPPLGLGSARRGDDPERLGALLAARTGRDPVAVQQLLNGPAPADDDALVRLADDLDRLEQEAQQL